MKKLIAILCTTLLASCAVTPSYEQTMVSTKSYDFTNKNLVLGKKVVGSSQQFSGYSQYAHKEAVDDAMSRNNCTVALINVKALDNGRSIEGTEVIDPTLGNCAK